MKLIYYVSLITKQMDVALLVGTVCVYITIENVTFLNRLIIGAT